MGWNPETYNKFREERQAPFTDLLKLINRRENISVIDLGCGTGELTSILADALPGSRVLGIDNSAEMLSKAAAFSNYDLQFEQEGITEITESGKKFDLIFSNAALQWLDDHEKLIPDLIRMLNDGGQLAAQVPANHNHFTHFALNELAASDSYNQIFKGWTRKVNVLDIDAYAQILFENGGRNIIVFEKIYPHMLKDADAVFEWMSGTALIRFLDRLPESMHENFKEDYKKIIRGNYTTGPVFYPFRRIIFSAVFSKL